MCHGANAQAKSALFIGRLYRHIMHYSTGTIYSATVLLFLCVTPCIQAATLDSPGSLMSSSIDMRVKFQGSELLQDLENSNGPRVKDDLVDAFKEVDIWGRVRLGFAIPDIDNALVTKHVKWYSDRPDYIKRTTGRASKYLFHVVVELEKRGMPTELALLPFIESAFNPEAYSSANAAGMWQFVPATGRNFNLKQNMFEDERRGVLASTDAALTYLQKLYGMFGDWQLALAAYNWGEGSVQRAIKKNQLAGKPIDFQSLADLMPEETRNYYPKLQAVKNIVSRPGDYGINLLAIENQPYFTAIDKTSDIDVAIAAQLAEMTLEDFRALNPQFNRPVITGNAKTTILLPQKNVEKFKFNLARWGHALSSWTTHTITSSKERLDALASRFGTTSALLRGVNHIPTSMQLRAGSTIIVPKTSASSQTDISPDLADRATMVVEADRPLKRRFALVTAHDTLASIAKKYKVTVEQIKNWNNLRHDRVKKGQHLQLQSSDSSLQ
jgi:membrane-bound lytic murein transglycosylase D